MDFPQLFYAHSTQCTSFSYAVIAPITGLSVAALSCRSGGGLGSLSLHGCKRAQYIKPDSPGVFWETSVKIDPL